MIGRLISAAMAIVCRLAAGRHAAFGQPMGHALTTLFYVVVGCAMQFVIGTGLAFLCSQPICGQELLPRDVLHSADDHAARRRLCLQDVLDITKGPFQPFWEWIGLGDWAWSADAWAARWFIVIGDSWQWIPFIFIVMLAALENVPQRPCRGSPGRRRLERPDLPRNHLAADRAGAATVMLIRMIEAFKIVDLPNIMTSGGPGIATESMTLHSFFLWRANDMGSSAAVAYLLLFLTVVVCASFFNYVVLEQLRKAHA